jgi:hypothetical protein
MGTPTDSWIDVGSRPSSPARGPGSPVARLSRLVHGGSPAAPDRAAFPTLRRVPAGAPGPANPLLLTTVPVELSRPLLLGRGAIVRPLPGPVHLPDLPAPLPSTQPGGRPHRGDRPRWGVPRLSEPADRLPVLPSGQDPCLPPHLARRAIGLVRPPRHGGRERYAVGVGRGLVPSLAGRASGEPVGPRSSSRILYSGPKLK